MTRPRAFTLIEVLLAVSLSVLLFGAMLGFYKYTAETRKTAVEAIQVIQSRRQVLERITEQLRAATGYIAMQGGPDSVTFVTTAVPPPAAYNETRQTDTPRSPQDDVRLVTYGTQKYEDEEGVTRVAGLQVSVQKLLTAKVVEEDASSDSPTASGGPTTQDPLKQRKSTSVPDQAGANGGGSRTSGTSGSRGSRSSGGTTGGGMGGSRGGSGPGNSRSRGGSGGSGSAYAQAAGSGGAGGRGGAGGTGGSRVGSGSETPGRSAGSRGVGQSGSKSGTSQGVEQNVAEKPASAVETAALSSSFRFIRFQYFDGTNWTDSWNNGELPRAVEVAIGRDELPEGVEPGDYPFDLYRRVVTIHAARLPKGNGP